MDWRTFYRVLDAIHARSPISTIIHGAARGADGLADIWADNWGVAKSVYPAKWEDVEAPDAVVKYRDDGTAYNVAAGGQRNQRMLNVGCPELAVVLPGGSGTRDMIARLNEHGRVPTIMVDDLGKTRWLIERLPNAKKIIRAHPKEDESVYLDQAMF
jgi:hypothetical protein